MPADFETLTQAIGTLPQAGRKSLTSYTNALNVLVRSVDLPAPFADWANRAAAHTRAIEELLVLLEDDSAVMLEALQRAQPAKPAARPRPKLASSAQLLRAEAAAELEEEEEELEEEESLPKAEARTRPAADEPDDPDTPTAQQLLDRFIAQDAVVQQATRRMKSLDDRLKAMRKSDPNREKVAKQIETIRGEIQTAFSQMSDTMAEAKLVRAIGD